MAFPPAHMLVGAGVAEVVRAVLPLPRWKAWTLAAALAVSPDFDFVLGILAGRATMYHGTFTHSVSIALAVGVVAGAFGGARWGVLAAAGYGSHLLVDLLDARGRTNVLLAWPITERRPFALAKVFPTVPFEQGNGFWNALLSLLRPEVFGALLEQTLVAGAFFVALFLLGRLLARVTNA